MVWKNGRQLILADAAVRLREIGRLKNFLMGERKFHFIIRMEAKIGILVDFMIQISLLGMDIK